MNNETNITTEEALKTINLVLYAIGNNLTGNSFLGIRNYSNKSGEVANHLLNVGINYDKSVKKDIITLENLNVAETFPNEDIALLDEARRILIEAFIKPNANRSKGQADAYTTIINGVKVHKTTGNLYIYGYRENKTVITEGVYKEVKSKDLTIAKNKLRKLLITGKFVNYVIDSENIIRGGGNEIIIE